MRIRPILTAAFIILGLAGFAQLQTIRINDDISFQLPSGYSSKDTMDTRNYSFSNDTAEYTATAIAVEGSISSEKDLEKYYKNFMEGYLSNAPKCDLVSSDIITFNDLKALRASLTVNTDRVKRIKYPCELLVLELKSQVYVFQLAGNTNTKLLFNDYIRHISISPEIKKEDQLTKRDFFSIMIKILKYAGIPFLLIGYFMFSNTGSRKKKEQNAS